MIPMVDLKRQYGQLKTEIDQAVLDVLGKTQFILGPNVVALEQEIAAYHNLPAAVGVANGTDALRVALRACGIGPGDEVITTPFTFIATIEVILDVGAVPVFADISADTFNIDPEQIAACITDRTRAVLPVHLYGQPAPMKAIMAIAEQHGLKVIEDCAQAFGATLDGQVVGSFGHCGCYSFFPSKNLGCFGDGGMVVTSDPEVAEQIKVLRNHGSAKQYHHTTVGYNSRLDEVQAAILRIKLQHIDAMNDGRRKAAQRYGQHIARADVTLPYEAPGCKHVYHQFTIKSPKRDVIMSRLQENQIACALYYPVPLHQQQLFAGTPVAQTTLPVTEALAKEVVSLPMFPELTEEEIVKIARVVNAAE